jgi:hypothetical protein
MIRIALHGQLKQAENYLELFQDFPHFILSAIFPTDQNMNVNGKMIDQPAPLIFNEEELMMNSDVILFLNFKSTDFLLLKRALKESKHIFINPSQILFPEIINQIHKLGDEAGIIYYIKHKILNPELQEILDNSYDNLEFTDIYRYVPSNLELKENVLRKIIAKEILFMFSVNNHEITKYKIKTVPYCSDSPFIINVRFDFSNASTANLTINFFTPNNARFAELYYSKNLLRLNSKDGEVEFIAPDKNSFNVIRKKYSMNSEMDASPEIINFLNRISISGKPGDYKNSGLFAHELIWEVLRDISSIKKSSV